MNDSMNDSMNEWMNEWMNLRSTWWTWKSYPFGKPPEGMNKLMNEWMNDLINEWMNEWVKDQHGEHDSFQ